MASRSICMLMTSKSVFPARSFSNHLPDLSRPAPAFDLSVPGTCQAQHVKFNSLYPLSNKPELITCSSFGGVFFSGQHQYAPTWPNRKREHQL